MMTLRAPSGVTRIAGANWREGGVGKKIRTASCHRRSWFEERTAYAEKLQTERMASRLSVKLLRRCDQKREGLTLSDGNWWQGKRSKSVRQDAAGRVRKNSRVLIPAHQRGFLR